MYHIIINPASKSGRGMKIWNSLLPLLTEKNIVYHAHFTTGFGHATQIAAHLTTELTTESIKLIVLGGDGTINEVIQGIGNFSKTYVGYIPTGSSNDLARDLHLETIAEKALLAILEEKNITSMDLGQIQILNGFYRNSSVPITPAYPYHHLFCVSSGIGFDAAVCEEALSSKIKDTLNHMGLGKLTYLGIALKQLLKKNKVSCDLQLDDGDIISFSNFLFIASMIHRYEGGGFMFCPNAKYNDGLIDICIAKNMPLLRAFKILPTAFSGNHTRFEEIHSYQGKKLYIKTSHPLFVHTDGEVSTSATELIVTLSAHQLHFIH